MPNSVHWHPPWMEKKRVWVSDIFRDCNDDTMLSNENAPTATWIFSYIDRYQKGLLIIMCRRWEKKTLAHYRTEKAKEAEKTLWQVGKVWPWGCLHWRARAPLRRELARGAGGSEAHILIQCHSHRSMREVCYCCLLYGRPQQGWCSPIWRMLYVSVDPGWVT